MAHRVNVSLNYGTHLPALMRAMWRTTGPVLELGMGLFSTPYLHYACHLAGRRLVSFDNNAGWAEIFAPYRSAKHTIEVVDDWADADIDHPWSVALVDHSPAERREIDIRRLRDYTNIIIAHDSNGRYENQYHYERIYPLFKYRADWTRDGRHAAVLSTFVDLKGFWD